MLILVVIADFNRQTSWWVLKMKKKRPWTAHSDFKQITYFAHQHTPGLIQRQFNLFRTCTVLGFISTSEIGIEQERNNPYFEQM
jgi:hypothetical protein